MPPTIVPPAKNLGMIKLQDPSRLCFVTVCVAAVKSVRTVWPIVQIYINIDTFKECVDYIPRIG